MLRIPAALILCLIGATAHAAGCVLPADTTTRVGRGQLWDYYYAPPTIVPSAARIANGVRDWLWNNNAGPFTSPPVTYPASVSTGIYEAVDRWDYQSQADPSGTFTVTWFEANHPDWLVYQADGKTIAWEFQDPYPAIAIWNTALQSWEASQIAPYESEFQNLSLDNVDIDNIWGRVGTWSGSPAITTTTGASSGASSIPVASITGFAIGQQVIASDGSSTVYYVGYVNGRPSGGSIPVTPNLGQNLPSSAQIWTAQWMAHYSGAATTTTATTLSQGATSIPVADSSAFTTAMTITIPNNAGTGDVYQGLVGSIPDGTHITLNSGITTAVHSGVAINGVPNVDSGQMASDIASLFAALKASLPNLCIWPNFTYVEAGNMPDTRMATVLNASDGFLDEGGFFENCAARLSGAALVNKIVYYAGLTQAIDINSYLVDASDGCITPGASPADPLYAGRMFNLAAYLMTKRTSGDHTYLSESDVYSHAVQDWYSELYLSLGTPDGAMSPSTFTDGTCEVRTFGSAGVVALLNPSPDQRCSYTPSAEYHSTGGTPFPSGVPIVLSPASSIAATFDRAAAVLIKGASTK